MIQILKNEKDISIDLPFFAQEKYLSSKCADYGWFDSEDFLLPFKIHKTYIFKRMVFTSEVLHKNNKSIEEERAFLDNVVSYIKENKTCDFIHKPHPGAVFKTYPKKSKAFKWASYVLEIESSIDKIIDKMSSKSQRRNVRKAIAEGVKVELTDDAEEVYNLCNDTLVRQKIQLTIDKNEFMKQFEKFHPNNMLMFKASFDNIVEGAIVVFKDKNNAYAKYSGSIEQPRYGLMKTLDAFALEELANNHNIKTFDLIGAIPDIKEDSKEARFQKSKKDLGAQLKTGYQFSLVINPIKYKLFNFLLKINFKLKGIEYICPIKRSKSLSATNLEI